MLLSFLLYWFSFHTYNTFPHSYIHEHSPRLLSIPSQLNCSVADTSLGCPVGIRTRGLPTASRRATNWVMSHPYLSHVAPSLSHAAPSKIGKKKDDIFLHISLILFGREDGQSIPVLQTCGLWKHCPDNWIQPGGRNVFINTYVHCRCNPLLARGHFSFLPAWFPSRKEITGTKMFSF